MVATCVAERRCLCEGSQRLPNLRRQAPIAYIGHGLGSRDAAPGGSGADAFFISRRCVSSSTVEPLITAIMLGIRIGRRLVAPPWLIARDRLDCSDASHASRRRPNDYLLNVHRGGTSLPPVAIFWSAIHAWAIASSPRTVAAVRTSPIPV